MTAPRSRLFAVAAATAALLPMGCAQENPRLIPRDDADALVASIDEVGAAVADDECARAQQELAEARAQVDGLPTEVARSLTERLRQGLEHLEAQIPVDCQSQPDETATPAATETPEATATPEDTATPTPTPEETPTPTVEPEGDDGVPGGEEPPAP